MVEARLRVIFGDTDNMGVVYYANYLRFFEFGRNEYLRARGGSYRALEEEGFFFPVVEAVCHYKASAQYDDMLIIRTRVSQLRRATVTFSYELLREGEPHLLLATGHTRHGCVGRDRKPVQLPVSLTRHLPEPAAIPGNE